MNFRRMSILFVLVALLSACGASPATTASQSTTAPQVTIAVPAATAAATVAPQATAAPAAVTAAPQATTAPAAAGATKKSAITLYTSSDTNIRDWMQNTVFPAFMAKYPQYQIQLIDSGSAGTDPIIKRAIAALQTGSDPQVELLEGDPRDSKDAVQAGLWYKPTVADIPNLANVIKDAQATDMAAPYRGSQVLLAYNSAEVPANEVPTTYAGLLSWIKAHPGKFAYCRPDKGGSGSGFVERAVYEASGNKPSLWVNPFNQQLVDQYYPKAIQLLQDIHPYIY
nr:extracellular solute-binding protein [Herpetosiphonaceae bacterium]